MIKYEPVEYQVLGDNINNLDLELDDILTIRDDRNVVYICHPNHVFKNCVTSDNKEILSVDWDNIDINMMFLHDDYGCYSIIEQVYESDNNQFNYIKKKASHMLRKYANDGAPNYSYPFVVVEEMDSDTDYTYFVRGIISCSEDGVKLAYNPQWEHVKSYQKKIEM